MSIFHYLVLKRQIDHPRFIIKYNKYHIDTDENTDNFFLISEKFKLF